MGATVESNCWPAAIVGAGAAGFTAAIFAARQGLHVLLLETRRAPGAKIRVSGGGRCNILPSQVTLADYHSQSSPNAVRNVLLSWPLAAVHRFFHTELGIPLKTEPSGKVFPASDRSKDIVDALAREADRLGVRVLYNSRIEGLTRRDGLWHLTRLNAPPIIARRVALCCGGLSMPKTGSDGAGWRMARQMQHSLHPTYPVLVPLLTTTPLAADLAGLSAPVRLMARRGHSTVGEATGGFLFTHRGFSGPAVLNISRHFTAPTQPADPPTALFAHWGDPINWSVALGQARQGTVRAWLRQHLPRRLVDLLLEKSGITADGSVAELRRPDRQTLIRHLTETRLDVSGGEGYAVAEATAGGVALNDVYLSTLESRRSPNLYIAGEMLDVVGRLGGYNFLWAWVTGRKVGFALGAPQAARTADS